MGYLLLFFFAWLLVCLPALIYAGIIEGRRRRDVALFEKQMAALRHDFELLERRSQSLSAAATMTATTRSASPAPAPERPPAPVHPAFTPQVAQPRDVPALTQPAAFTHPTAAAHNAPPAQAQLVVPKPVAPAAEKPLPPPPVEKPVATPPPPPPPAVTTQPIHPATAAPPAPLPVSAAPTQPAPAAPIHPTTPPVRPPSTSVTPAISTSVTAPGSLHPSISASAPLQQRTISTGTIPPSPAPKPAKRSRSLEETIGTNWLPKVGVVIIVIGLGLLTARAWSQVTSVWQYIGPWGRSAIVLLGGLSMLFGGIAFEKRDRYKILGRAMIGGGWATAFLIAYAVRHAPAFMVLTQNSADLAVLLAVAGAMVWHTLKYNSQTVTGLAFLLGFAAVTLNPDPPFNLIAGALLITGMTVIVLRRQWYELEVFGILASYGNHFYWLYTSFHTLQKFPDHTASVALMIGYWVIFRTSYLLHKISQPQQEKVSTAAALLNPLLFLGVMKYQSFHPEWAFPALLIMGAVEFVLGQLPVSRRRRLPFQILSSLGAALMVIAVPIRYAGHANELILFWLVGAELFLLAGIFARERLFRGFGLIISFLIALYALPVHVAPLADKIFNRQPCHDARLSIVLGVIAFFLYSNAHLTRAFWRQLFEEDPERKSLTLISYIASLFATAAIYASVPESAVAVILAIFLLILSWTGRQASITELIYQGHWIAAVAVAQVSITGSTLASTWLGIPARMLSFAMVAASLYCSSRFVRLSETANKGFFTAAYAWFATGLLTLLIWFQGPPWAVAVLWIVLGLALSLVGQGLRRTDLKWHAFVLVWLSAARALASNFDLNQPFFGLRTLSMRLVTISSVALGTYLLAVWAPRLRLRAVYTVIATSLVALLIYQEVSFPWIVVGWVALALVLAAGERWLTQLVSQPGELRWQAFFIVVMSFGWAWPSNFDLKQPFYFTSLRLVTVSLTALGIYLLARWAPQTRLRPVYSVMGTTLLSALAFKETKTQWTALVWISLAVVLGAAARRWKDRSLLWQTHLLAALAAGWTLYANFAPEYRGSRAQLISVGATAILLYVLARIANVAGVIEDHRISWAYSWAGSLLLSWLAWYQLEAANVSLAWGVFGLLLFELPDLLKAIGMDATRSAANWRAQAYVALFSSFAHLFYANFNSPVTGTFLQVLFDPRLLTVYPLVLIYFGVYWRMHESMPATAPPQPHLKTKAVNA